MEMRSTRVLKQSAVISVVIAAWVRGWTLEQIAFASGSSHQSIKDRILKYERKHGKQLREYKPSYPARGRVGKTLWRCSQCGKSKWALSSKSEAFCSTKCRSDFFRVVSDESIKRAIDMRWAGHSWTSVSFAVSHEIQVIQTRIWKYLYQRGALDMEAVISIWRPDDRYASWRWIELTTGLIPTETNPRIVKLGYPSRKGSAWGKRIVRGGTTPDTNG
jgi:hypothetical protein